MKKIIFIFCMLISFAVNAQFNDKIDSLTINKVILMDTNAIQQLDTAVNSHDAVPLFQMQDSINGIIGNPITDIDYSNISMIKHTLSDNTFFYKSGGHGHPELALLGAGTSITDNYVVIGTGSGIEGLAGFRFDGSTVTITPDAANRGLFIDQGNNAIALEINSEASGAITFYPHGKYVAAFEQDIDDGYGLSILRNLNNVGSYPLVKFVNDHAANTQPTLFIDHDGTGGATGYPLHIDSENAAAVALKIDAAFAEIGLTNGAIVDNTDADTLEFIETVVKITGEIATDGIIKTISTNQDLVINTKGTGVISVSGTTNYEDNVTDDDDIPNRKFVVDYVDNAVTNDILTIKTSLNALDVNALGTAKTLIAAPGLTEIIQIIEITWVINVTTRLEVGAQTLELKWENSSGFLVFVGNASVESVTDLIIQANGRSALNTDLKPNDAFVCILSATTNPSSGSATMDFYITYRIITL